MIVPYLLLGNMIVICFQVHLNHLLYLYIIQSWIALAEFSMQAPQQY